MSDSTEPRISWGHQATCDLISLYRKHPVLYSSTNADYKNKEKRLQALQSIKTELLKKGRIMAIDDIKRKIHGLRTQYSNQVAKMKKSGDSKVTLWCYYNQLDFLKADLEGQSSEGKNIWTQEETQEDDDCDDITPNYENGGLIKEEMTEEEDTVQMPVFLSTSYSTRQDDLATFGKLVELELRKISSPQLLRKAKKEILSILMDAQEGCEN